MKLSALSHEGGASASPGGWASTITVPATALARLPDGLTPADACAFGCAGVTTFNALRHSGAAMGFETAAIERGAEKRALAAKLGARHCIDAEQQHPGAEKGSAGDTATAPRPPTGAGATGENACDDDLKSTGRAPAMDEGQHLGHGP